MRENSINKSDLQQIIDLSPEDEIPITRFLSLKGGINSDDIEWAKEEIEKYK